MEDQEEHKETKSDLWTLNTYCDFMPELMENARLEKIRASSKGRKGFLEELRETAEKYLHDIRLEQYRAKLNPDYHLLINLAKNKDNIKKKGSGLYA